MSGTIPTMTPPSQAALAAAPPDRALIAVADASVGYGGEPVLTGYAASKGALAVLTKNAGYQLQPDRIRVCGLNIGWTATAGEHGVQTDTGQPQDWLAQAYAGRPLGRLLRPEDIAPMVTYLLSDAADMVHGVTLPIDGGFLAT